MVKDTYLKPGFFTTRVVNPTIVFLARRLGWGMKGARVLSVQGRKTGQWHSTPVNPLSLRVRGIWWSPGVKLSGLGTSA